MSRSFSPSSADNSPLLPLNNHDISLHDLSSRPSRSPAASPSPPPSFYRPNVTHNLSPSPSRTRSRKIQFIAPPPPITTSIILSPTQHGNRQVRSSSSNLSSSIMGRGVSPRIRRGGGGIDPLLGLERREKAIQNELQLLLDAQSAGLVQGFGGDIGRDGSSDAGSSTPTSRSLQRSSSKGKSRGITPVRQPKGKVVGLRGARRGLLRDMEQLVEVKSEEGRLLAAAIESREEVLRQVEIWERRIEGVTRQLNGYIRSEDDEPGDVDEDFREISELRNEERVVENEIREMEERLAQMKARKLWIGERIKEGVNKRESRLSSYRGTLREVESEVKEFLKRPPIPVSIVMADEEGFMALPAHRRTLEMAREWWVKEVSQLQGRKQEVETEKSALEEGAQMWEDSAYIVMEFEDELRKQMANNHVQDAESLRAQVGRMRKVIEKLGENARLAEKKGWNLLICAVGAELEAFREGEGILKGALELVVGELVQKQDGKTVNGKDLLGNGLDGLNGVEERNESLEREDSEDDGPNLAELLVDRGDPDDTS